MPISQNEAKRRLAELSSQGGGLIYGAAKSEINPNSRVLVIGLGGLGCKTVNELVGVYRRDFRDAGCLSWLAVDTDRDCFDKISNLNGGNIEAADQYSVYKPEVEDLLMPPRTPYIESFVSADVPPVKITNKGAQQRRIVGKTMLCGGPAYGELRNIIQQRMIAMGGGPGESGMQIVIVAGISGGTGSGTFVDVSYMVRELAKVNGNNEVFGVFYTPDVQRNETWCTGAIWSNLQRNGYASMKELDYFMSVGSGDEVVYSLPLDYPINIDGRQVRKLESKLPIFEREYVFFVSETDTMKSEEDIVGATAISLLNLFRKSNALKGDQTQSILSNLCNIRGVIDTWGNDHIGISRDPDLPKDPAKMAHTNYPVSMHYSYASFDFKSIYVPRNEMAAYCTNLILKDLHYNKFEKAIRGIGNADVMQFAELCGLDSFEKIYATADTVNNWHGFNFRIQENTPEYPQPGLMRVKCDASAAVQKAKDMAIDAISTASADMDKIWNSYKSAIDANLFNNPGVWNLVGPYGAIVFMSGTDDGSVKGLIQRVEEFKSQLPSKTQAMKNARDAAENAMISYKNELAEDLRVTDAEIVRMVDLCEAFSKAEYDFQLYLQAMPVVLSTIESRLVELNNKTFATYIPVMRAIEEIVNEDANRFMHSTLQNNGYGAVFCVDAFNIDNALANGTLFEDFFRGYLDNTEVINAEQQLFSTLFNKENRQYWEALAAEDDITLASSQAVQKIRDVFQLITNPLISNMLEKFLVMIYCDPQVFKSTVLQPGEDRAITLTDLNTFWETNPQQRNSVLLNTAEKILAELDRGGMIKFGVDPSLVTPFDSEVEVVSIPDLPNLNDILRTKFQAMNHHAFSVADPDAFGNMPKTEIALFKSAGPFPLPFVYRMRDYATHYFASEEANATAAGRHGDEVTERWQENMPELYGVDAERYFEETRAVAPIPDSGHLRGNHDQIVFDEVRTLVKDALASGYIYPSQGTQGDIRYKLVTLKKQDYTGNPTLTVDVLLEKIIDKLLYMLSEFDLTKEEAGALPTWVDAVKALGDEEHHNAMLYLDEQNLDTNVCVINSTFTGVQAASPEYDYEITNLERLIRMDMTMLNKIRNEAKFFADKDFFGEIERKTAAVRREQGLKELVGYYLAAYKLGWISIDRGHLICQASTGQTEDLMNCSAGFGLELDSQLEVFLKLSAFCSKLEDNDVMKKRIQDAYAPFQVTDDLLTAEQLTAKQAMPAWKTEILEPLETVMASTTFKDYDMEPIYAETYKKFTLSRYQDAYSYPIEVAGGKDVIDNVKKVIAALNHYVVVGDNMLVPSIDF